MGMRVDQRMSGRDWVAGLWAFMLLGASVLFLLGQFINWPELVGKPWVGNLFQALGAIGTAAAVWVALHFGLQAQREQARQQHEAATLAAAGVAPTLRLAMRRLTSSGVFFGFHDETVDRTDDTVLRRSQDFEVTEIVKVLGEPVFMLDEIRLAPLIPLGSNCAHRLHAAFASLRAVKHEIDSQFPLYEWNRGVTEDREIQIQEWVASICEAVDYIRVALEICEAAAEVGAPYPSAEELHLDGN